LRQADSGEMEKKAATQEAHCLFAKGQESGAAAVRVVAQALWVQAVALKALLPVER
jgi:hypothetical protein